MTQAVQVFDNLKVRWARVNKYLGSATCGAEVKVGNYITEPQFYKLAIKANLDKRK